MDIEPRKETTDLKRKEPLDQRFKGDAKVPAYRRWLQRRLVEAQEAGDQRAIDAVMKEMRQAGMTDGK